MAKKIHHTIELSSEVLLEDVLKFFDPVADATSGSSMGTPTMYLEFSASELIGKMHHNGRILRAINIPYDKLGVAEFPKDIAEQGLKLYIPVVDTKKWSKALSTIIKYEGTNARLKFEAQNCFPHAPIGKDNHGAMVKGADGLVATRVSLTIGSLTMAIACPSAELVNYVDNNLLASSKVDAEKDLNFRTYFTSDVISRVSAMTTYYDFDYFQIRFYPDGKVTLTDTNESWSFDLDGKYTTLASDASIAEFKAGTHSDFDPKLGAVVKRLSAKNLKLFSAKSDTLVTFKPKTFVLTENDRKVVTVLAYTEANVENTMNNGKGGDSEDFSSLADD